MDEVRSRSQRIARTPKRGLEAVKSADLRQLLPRVRSRTERNVWYLYLDVFWAGIFMAAIAFNATYALRLGASNTQIGWLSSIPSLLAMIVLMPAARLLESKSDRAPWLRWSLFIGRGAFVGAALAPWLFPERAAEVLIAVLILRTLPMQIFSAGFTPLVADIVPARDRALVVSNRNIIMSATVAVCTFLFGEWMDAATRISWATFPVSYQVVYLIGTVAGLLSSYFVSRIEAPPTPVIPRPRKSLRAPKPKAMVEDFRKLVTGNRGFARIVLDTFVFNLGAWLVGPLYTIFFVKQLGASDGWIGLNTTVAHIAVIAGYIAARKLLARKGAGWTLRATVPLSAAYAFLVSFFPNLNLILVWGIFINLVNSSVNLSHGNMLYELCPTERRASYMAIYSTIANVGAFVAPMIGVALSETIDIRWLLLVGGAIRLVGAGLYHLYPIDVEADGTSA
jgi:Na+/melibiose symporter-like transporter